MIQPPQFGYFTWQITAVVEGNNLALLHVHFEYTQLGEKLYKGVREDTHRKSVGGWGGGEPPEAQQ